MQNAQKLHIEVFHRYEKKYMLEEEQYYKVIEELKQHMQSDQYNREKEFYTICNIYYDTAHDQLIQRSLEKPVYKEKLRLRSYGIPELDSRVFLEIKKKYKGLVNKRRTVFTLSDAYRFVEDDTSVNLQGGNPQVIKELQYFLHLYQGLEAKVYIAYDRKAFFGIEEPNLRVTFDTNIRARRENVRLEAGDWGEVLLPEGKRLMEIKSIDTMPLWLVDILNRYEIRSTSFSKYGTEYQNWHKRKELI